MKFLQLEAFEKHLSGAFPQHLAKIYFIVCGDDFERKFLISGVKDLLKKKENLQIIKCHSCEEALMHLNHTSLFSEGNLVIVDDLEQSSVKENLSLEKYLLTPSPSSYLILGASSEKTLQDLYLKGKKEVVMLDLSGEKPWVRKQRIRKSLENFVKDQGKNLASAVLDFFMENMPLDQSLMYQELSKISLFTGERKQIKMEDIHAIASLSKTVKSWQVAENLVWEDGQIEASTLELADLFLLIGQIRYHLELGLKMSCILQRDPSITSLKMAFSDLKPASFEKYLSILKKKKINFFKKGLLFLYDWEFAMKNSQGSPIMLFDLFRTKLHSQDI